MQTTVDRRTADLLAPFFPRWRGDASEPAPAKAPTNRPAPAATRAMVPA